MRPHPVLKDKKPGSGRQRQILAHVEVTEDEIVHMPLLRKVHGELVERLPGSFEDIFTTLRDAALL